MQKRLYILYEETLALDVKYREVLSCKDYLERRISLKELNVISTGVINIVVEDYL